MGAPRTIDNGSEAARTGAVWLSAHMIDLVALPLGFAVTLRFWCALLGVHSQAFVLALTAAALCEMARRLMDARREWRRPQIVCGDRRLDFVAAILLGTGPWPITLPLAARLESLPGWCVVLVVVTILGIALRRLSIGADSRWPDNRRRSVRDLTSVPHFHSASLFVLSSDPHALRP